MKYLVTAIAIALAPLPCLALQSFLQSQWLGPDASRFCSYSDGSVINVGFAMCPAMRDDSPPEWTASEPHSTVDSSIPLQYKAPHILTPYELLLMQQQLRR